MIKGEVQYFHFFLLYFVFDFPSMVTRTARPARRRLPFYIPLIIALAIVAGVVYTVRFFLPSNNAGGNVYQPVAQFTLSSGNARVLLNEDTVYTLEPSADVQKLNVGEGVETIGATRLEITLQDGSIVRLDGNSSIRITDFKSVNNKKSIELSLQKGNAWIKIASADALDSFKVAARLSFIQIQSGTFAITRNGVEDIYRGIRGSAVVTILDNGGKNRLVSNELGLGQEIRVTDAIVADLAAKKDIPLLSLPSPEFRNSDWYAYNETRDSNNQPFENQNKNVMPSENVNSNTTAESVTENTNSIATAPGDGPVVKVTSPTDSTIVSENSVVIKGTVSTDATKVVVDDYTLQKYTAGASNWSYTASIANGGLIAGKNVFKIYAVDSSGQKGDMVYLTLYYDDKGTTNTNANSGTTTGRLSVPVITSPNGGKDYETSETSITIGGTVDARAAKVVVNGYVLTKYTPGSTSWQYFPTLIEGINTYSVYAMDKDGNRSPTVTLRVTYKKGATGSGSSL